jgi:hypothetical protein
MNEPIRLLNEVAIEEFRRYLIALRSDPTTPPPFYLLHHHTTSTEAPFAASVARQPHGRPFSSRYEFGCYLHEALVSADRTTISREHRLWTWLALFYFDQLCPQDGSGRRKPIKDEAYILDPDFKYNSYYRHFVRTPWVAVGLHPVESRVLLTSPGVSNTPLARRGEIIEQIAASPTLLRSRTVVRTADILYFDEGMGRPRKGAGGAGAGSPRRLVRYLQQLNLTYDLEAVAPERIISILPREFKKFVDKAVAASPLVAS